jgi:SAM-dependent methyltransferase
METQILPNLVNKTTFARADVLEYFQDLDALFEPEKVLFKKLSPVIRNKKILDIGIGGGRTTQHLLQITDDYTGIDYVREFAEETGRKYPKAKISQGDATNLKEFEDDSFDFVLFSFNGLDCVPSQDTIRITSISKNFPGSERSNAMPDFSNFLCIVSIIYRNISK